MNDKKNENQDGWIAPLSDEEAFDRVLNQLKQNEQFATYGQKLFEGEAKRLDKGKDYIGFLSLYSLLVCCKIVAHVANEPVSWMRMLMTAIKMKPVMMPMVILKRVKGYGNQTRRQFLGSKMMLVLTLAAMTQGAEAFALSNHTAPVAFHHPHALCVDQETTKLIGAMTCDEIDESCIEAEYLKTASGVLLLSHSWEIKFVKIANGTDTFEECTRSGIVDEFCINNTAISGCNCTVFNGTYVAVTSDGKAAKEEFEIVSGHICGHLSGEHAIDQKGVWHSETCLVKYEGEDSYTIGCSSMPTIMIASIDGKNFRNYSFVADDSPDFLSTSWNLPLDWQSYTGKVTFTFLWGLSEFYVTQADHVGSHVCSVHDCIFCYQSYTDFKCKPVMAQMEYVFTWIFAIVGMLSVVRYLPVLIIWAACNLSWSCLGGCVNLFRRKPSKTLELSTSEENKALMKKDSGDSQSFETPVKTKNGSDKTQGSFASRVLAMSRTSKLTVKDTIVLVLVFLPLCFAQIPTRTPSKSTTPSVSPTISPTVSPSVSPSNSITPTPTVTSVVCDGGFPYAQFVAIFPGGGIGAGSDICEINFFDDANEEIEAVIWDGYTWSEDIYNTVDDNEVTFWNTPAPLDQQSIWFDFGLPTQVNTVRVLFGGAPDFCSGAVPPNSDNYPSQMEFSYSVDGVNFISPPSAFLDGFSGDHTYSLKQAFCPTSSNTKTTSPTKSVTTSPTTSATQSTSDSVTVTPSLSETSSQTGSVSASGSTSASSSLSASGSMSASGSDSASDSVSASGSLSASGSVSGSGSGSSSMTASESTTGSTSSSSSMSLTMTISATASESASSTSSITSTSSNSSTSSRSPSITYELDSESESMWTSSSVTFSPTGSLSASVVFMSISVSTSASSSPSLSKETTYEEFVEEDFLKDTSCSRETSYQVSSNNDCVLEGSVHNCSILPEVLMNLKSVGSSACLLFTQKSNTTQHSDHPWGPMLRMTFLRLRYLAVLTNAYCTAGWRLVTQSKYECYKTHGCDSDSVKEFAANTPPAKTWDKIQDGIVKTTPGLCTAERRTNGWQKGCFYSVDGCVYSCYGIVPVFPNNTYAEVNEVTGFIPMVDLELEYYDPLTHVVRRWNFTVESVFEDEEMFLTLDGYSPGSLIHLPQSEASVIFIRDVISSEIVDVILSAASSKNTPEYLKVGDIQAGNIGALKNPTVDSFLFDTKIIRSINKLQSENTYTGETPGYLKLGTSQVMRLPTVAGLAVWSFNTTSGMVEADMLRAGSIDVTVHFKIPLSFDMVHTTVCPVLKIHSVSGCYSCPEGAILNMTIKSNCHPGVVSLEATSGNCILGSNWIMTAEDHFLTEVIFCDAQDSSITIRATGTEGRTSSDSIEFQLIYNPLIDLTNVTAEVDTKPALDEGGIGASAFDWFPNLSKLWSSILTYLLYVVVIAITLALGVFLFKWYMKKMMEKKSQ
jgi:hypothetical protein